MSLVSYTEEKGITVFLYIDDVFWTPLDKIQSSTPDIVRCVATGEKVGDWYPITYNNKVIGVSNREDSILSYLSYISILEREKKTGMTFSRDLFLASMSHEIRTPLNGIVGYSQLLCRDNSLTEDQYRIVSSLNSCCLTLARLINDILDYSKLSSGKVKLNPSNTCVEEMVAQALNTLHTTLENHKVETYLEDKLSRVILDKGKVIQVLINLLSNASKYSPIKSTIVIRSWIKPPHLYISVKDSGIGIDPKETQNLFQAFARLSSSEHKEGVGLGLAICKRLVSLMDGKIEVVSSPKKGSLFTFSCRYTKEDIKESSKNQSGVLIKGKKIVSFTNNLQKRLDLADYGHLRDVKVINVLTLDELDKVVSLYNPDLIVMDKILNDIERSYPYIPLTDDISYLNLDNLLGQKKDHKSLKIDKNLKVLIAEDIEYNRELLVGMLKMLEIKNVKEAEDGLQTVLELSRDKYDLLLLDLKMPKMNGYQVFKYIKDNKISVRVVAVTAAVEEEERCKDVGIPSFLSKPIDISSLKNILLTCERS